jgi:hypothetical protein
LIVPEYLELPQNFCLIAGTDSRISGTAAEFLFDYKVQTPILDFLELPQYFGFRFSV